MCLVTQSIEYHKMDSDEDDLSLSVSDSSVVKTSTTKKKAKLDTSNGDNFSLDSDSSKENAKKSNKKPKTTTKSKDTKVTSSSAKNVNTKPSIPTSSSSNTFTNTTANIKTSSSNIKDSSVGISESWRGNEITTDSGAKALLLKYLLHQNRPYSVIQIYENLHKRIQKGTIERCLTALDKNETGTRLICKEYGKAKIYFPDQSSFPILSERERIQLQNEITNHEGQVSQKLSNEQQLKSKIAALSSEPSDNDIDR